MSNCDTYIHFHQFSGYHSLFGKKQSKIEGVRYNFTLNTSQHTPQPFSMVFLSCSRVQVSKREAAVSLPGNQSRQIVVSHACEKWPFWAAFDSSAHTYYTDHIDTFLNTEKLL